MIEALVSLVAGAIAPPSASQVRRAVMSKWSYGDNKGHRVVG
jgi:hypothetical protein